MNTTNYPTLFARVLGKRSFSQGVQNLSWRGGHWVRIGAVWIPISHFGA